MAWVAAYPDNNNTSARSNWKGWAKSYDAFRSAVERDGLDQVMAGTAVYWREKQGSEVGFNPTNFLNEGRYLDALAREQRRGSQPVRANVRAPHRHADPAAQAEEQGKQLITVFGGSG